MMMATKAGKEKEIQTLQTAVSSQSLQSTKSSPSTLIYRDGHIADALPHLWISLIG